MHISAFYTYYTRNFQIYIQLKLHFRYYIQNSSRYLPTSWHINYMYLSLKYTFFLHVFLYTCTHVRAGVKSQVLQALVRLGNPGVRPAACAALLTGPSRLAKPVKKSEAQAVRERERNMHIYICIHMHICKYRYLYVCVCVYVYIYI